MEYRLKKIDVNGSDVKEMPEYYAETAYIIISAFKLGQTAALEESIELNEKLKAKIRKSGYFHTPIWGNFQREGSESIVKEQSFIVFNFKGLREDKRVDSAELKSLGVTWCTFFDQEAFFYKEEGPSKKGSFFDGDGDEVMTSYEVRPLQAADIYFALLTKRAKKTVEKSKRTSYVEGTIYIARRPMTPNGETVAMRKGETFMLSS